MTHGDQLDPTAHPHDALFRWVFSQPEHAAGLLKLALPRALSDAIEWGTLRHEPGSFVDDALRNRHTDVAFTARLGEGTVVLYFVAEQQREPDDLMPFRFLIYKTRIWEKLLRDDPDRKRLPAIMHVLVYNNERGWSLATSFHDIIERKGLSEAAQAALLPYIAQFQMRVVDLNGQQADAIVAEVLTALGQVALWCMAVAGDDERFEREIEQLAEALDAILAAPNGFAALGVILRYLATTHTGFRAEKVGKLLKKAAGPRAQEVVMNFLEEIEQRGERRGERRGEQKGRAQMLLELLAMRFGDVSPAERERVMAANKSVLSTWGSRVLTATTLAEVLGESDTAGTKKASAPKRTAARKRARRA